HDRRTQARRVAERSNRPTLPAREPSRRLTRVALFDQLADLPIEVESYELEGLERDVSSDFTRLSTVVHLHGGGEEGVGEDVVYDALDHIAFQDAGPVHDLSGRRTLGGFCELIHELDLFPAPPVREVSP